jgi:hypothetical protein
MSIRSLKNTSVKGAQSTASGSAIVFSDTAPATPAEGTQWFDTTTGKTFIWYVDIDGGQWVDFGTGAGPEGPQGPQGVDGANGTYIEASTTGPTVGDGDNGDLWIVYS